MKALLITYSQAYNQAILAILEKHGQRGFTRWTDVQGRGSENGEPHLDSHAWPRMNDAILAVVKDSDVEILLSDIKAVDETSPELGLRAFVWNIENCY